LSRGRRNCERSERSVFPWFKSLHRLASATNYSEERSERRELNETGRAQRVPALFIIPPPALSADRSEAEERGRYFLSACKASWYMRESGSKRWEVARIRVRNLAYTVLQLFGFALVLWGVFEILGRAVLEYYQNESGSVPQLLTNAASTVPSLDQVTAIVVFGAGATVVWVSTR